MHCAALPVKTQKGDALLFFRFVPHLCMQCAHVSVASRLSKVGHRNDNALHQ